MGNAASKSAKTAGRSLKKEIPIPKVQKEPVKLAPSVASTRTPAPTTETPEADLQVDLRKRLQDIGPVQYKKHGIEPRPASEDAFTSTLEHRSKLQAAEDAEVEAAKTKSTGKKLLPSQTVHAVVKALQEGATREDVIRTYSLDPIVLDQLSALRVPKHVQPAQGRRRPPRQSTK